MFMQAAYRKKGARPADYRPATLHHYPQNKRNILTPMTSSARNSPPLRRGSQPRPLARRWAEAFFACSDNTSPAEKLHHSMMSGGDGGWMGPGAASRPEVNPSRLPALK